MQYAPFIQALGLVFTFETIMWLFVGSALGITMGALPGLTAPTAVALVLPLTFQMQFAPALGLLIGLYKGAIYGGSISAIVFSIPGTPASAATIADGYKLTQKGKTLKALLTALYASITSDLLASLAVILVAPFIIIMALSFGPAERFWLTILAIMLIGSLAGKHMAKGLFSAALGIYLATIGSDPISGAFRNTFNLTVLQDGIPLIPLVVGLFAIAPLLDDGIALFTSSERVQTFRMKFKDMFSFDFGEGLTFREYLRTWKEVSIGTIVGSIAGMLPGLGAAVGAFLSYSIAKQVSPNKRIGEGAIEGVAAAEAGNSATVGPALLPLLAFGIPGSATVALIGGALMLQGLTPSPRMFSLHPEAVYGIFIILIATNVCLLIIGRFFTLFFARLGKIPRHLIIPVIFMLSVIGTYVAEYNVTHVGIMLVIGTMAFGMRLFGIPASPLLITFMITPVMETNLRQALLIGRGQYVALFNSPLSIGLLVSVVIVLIGVLWLAKMKGERSV
ncbi:tripartite tricarboxylate transporter permease [Halomonas sp. HMF6819]|uniref:tripartite tricarboxylate transporter permease n=1 Tax=Halomonas sp. HMF6819 TaxID=3373085 RepID=UPI0037895236